MKASAAMSKYETYKDSGVERLGKIPVHWKLIRLKNAASINPSLNLKNYESNDHACFLPMEKVESSGLVDYGLQKPIKELKRGFTSFRRNDVIIAKITPCFENGKGAFLHSMPTDVGFGSTEFHVLRSFKGFSSSFLYYLSKTHFFMDVGEQLMIGSAGQKRIPTDFLVNFLFAAPSFEEQTAIAHFLDQKTAQIDAAIAIKEQQIALLKERKQILIQQAVTRGVGFDFAQPTDSDRSLSEVEGNSVPMKDSGVEWIGEIPAHWEVSRLSIIADVIDPNPSHRNPIYHLEGFPFISTVEFKNDDDIVLDTSRRVAESTVLEQEKRCRFKEGSLVFSRKGTIGAVRILPNHMRFALLDSLCVINASDKVQYHFLYLQLQSFFVREQFHSIVRGAALPQVSIGVVRLLKILIPPRNEQAAIVIYLHEETKKVSNAIVIQQQQIEKLREYKTTLINSAVTGKIRVTPEMVIAVGSL